MILTDLFTRMTSVQMNLPEDTIHKVISFQFDSVKQAMKTSKTIEITGLGKFKVRPAKVKSRIRKCEDMRNAYIKQLSTADENKTRVLNLKIAGLEEELSFLNNKL